MDLKEADDIKKRWQEYTEELYKKDLHDPDNHNGVITHLESDILECEVKWALFIYFFQRYKFTEHLDRRGGPPLAVLARASFKWALKSITTNKASGCDGIPVELFQILKDDAVKVLHSIC